MMRMFYLQTGPAAAVEAVEEHGEAASAEGEQAAAGSDAPEEQVAHAEEHRVDQREAQRPVEEVIAQRGIHLFPRLREPPPAQRRWPHAVVEGLQRRLRLGLRGQRHR